MARESVNPKNMSIYEVTFPPPPPESTNDCIRASIKEHLNGLTGERAFEHGHSRRRSKTPEERGEGEGVRIPWSSKTLEYAS